MFSKKRQWTKPKECFTYNKRHTVALYKLLKLYTQNNQMKLKYEQLLATKETSTKARKNISNCPTQN